MRASTCPYAAPGTILALGLILLWSWPLALTDTLWILLIAYFAKHLSFAVRSVTTAVQQTDVTLEEAARVSGASLHDDVPHDLAAAPPAGHPRRAGSSCSCRRSAS